MPGQPRLDAPDNVHQVKVRGLERRAIFREDADRADFVPRLAGGAEQGACTVGAWALLPNHAHLLVRTATRPLPRSMWSLLTGYAGAFNRRYTRSGHPFQTRRGLECYTPAWHLQPTVVPRRRTVLELDFVEWACYGIGHPSGHSHSVGSGLRSMGV
jgi:putative transposase